MLPGKGILQTYSYFPLLPAQPSHIMHTQTEWSPLPAEKVNVDLYGLVDEASLQQSGLSLLDLTTEQQHVGQRRLFGRLLLYEVNVPHPRQLKEDMRGRGYAEKKKSEIVNEISYLSDIFHSSVSLKFPLTNAITSPMAA